MIEQNPPIILVIGGYTLGTGTHIENMARVKAVILDTAAEADSWLEENPSPDLIVVNGNKEGLRWAKSYTKRVEQQAPIAVMRITKAKAIEVGATAYKPEKGVVLLEVEVIQQALGYPVDYCILAECRDDFRTGRRFSIERGHDEVMRNPDEMLAEAGKKDGNFLLKPVRPRSPFWDKPGSETSIFR